MTNREIKKAITENNLIIKNAENAIANIRLMCRHETQDEVLYYWRLGSCFPAICCMICGQFISHLKDDIKANTSC